MSARILSALAKLSRPFTGLSNDYRRTNNTECTELRTLTARSNEDFNVNKPKSIFPVAGKVPSSQALGSPSAVRHTRQRWSGWRFGILNFALWASLVFLINFVVTVWGSVAHRTNRDVLIGGDCRRIKILNSGLHVLINIFSTILLSGSNYCMQCLSAPTRREVDRAHAVGRWLDIGIPSFRNLRHINRRRLALWLLLGVSSLPLHLLYNSAVYASLSTNSYNVYLVSQAFVDDDNCRNCSDTSASRESYTRVLSDLWNKSRNGSLDRLDPAQCLTEYATMIQSNRRNLLLVTANQNVDTRFNSSSGLPLGHPSLGWINNTHVYWMDRFQASQGIDRLTAAESYSWICSALNSTGAPCANRLDEIKKSPQPWLMTDGCVAADDRCRKWIWPVDYCLSERAIPRCELRFSLPIAIIVTLLNFFKATMMFYVLHSTKENPLMTMGDAVASFLAEQDITTENLGLLGIHDSRTGYNTGATTWEAPRWLWKDATSRKRRIVTLVLLAVALTVVLALLIWGTKEVQGRGSIDFPAVLRLGFGAVDSRALIASPFFPTDMAGLALIANFPQVPLSMIYFAYNGLFTAMLMGYEWTSYACKRKGLRVSSKPIGGQRSTYFLQLPYRFGIPLIILSGSLHWLVSQSLFVVAIDVYSEIGNLQKSNLGSRYRSANMTCGYSPVSMLSVIILGTLMIAAIFGFGHIPYKVGMPLAGCSSMAISAACHPMQNHRDEGSVQAEGKLQYGVVCTGVDGIGHCAFSDQGVEPLVKGRIYG